MCVRYWLFNCRKGQLQPQFRLFKTAGDWTLDTQIQKFLPRFFCTRLQLLAYYDVEIPDMISVSELWRLVSWQSVIGPLHTGYLVTRYLQDNNVPMVLESGFDIILNSTDSTRCRVIDNISVEIWEKCLVDSTNVGVRVRYCSQERLFSVFMM